jgi:hypothetical protein
MAGRTSCFHILLFASGAVVGVLNTSVLKIIYGTQSIGLEQTSEAFVKPAFMAGVLMLGMSLGLPVACLFSIPKPSKSVIGHVAVVALFDLIATWLCNIGMAYVSMSIQQLLRGSIPVFAAGLRGVILSKQPNRFERLGLTLNAMAVTLVAAASSLGGADNVRHGHNPFVGWIFVLAGSLCQALQYVLEEKVLSMSSSKTERMPLSPLATIGFEGMWGVLFVSAIVLPLVNLAPGPDNGSIENAKDTWVMLSHSSTLQLWVGEMVLQLFVFNIIIININKQLGAVAKSMVALLRPGLVWVVQLLMHRVSKGRYGSAWKRWSWLQFIGLCLMLFGTCILGDLCGARGAVVACSGRRSGYWNEAPIREDLTEPLTKEPLTKEQTKQANGQ